MAHIEGNLGGANWSPDSARLAYTATSSGSDLIVTVLPTGASTTTTHQDGPLGAPSWSPDDATVMYSTGAGGAPIQHLSSPPEIGNKLIVVATEGGRGGGASFVVPWNGGTPGGTPRPVAAVGGGGGGRGGGGGNRLDGTHLLSSRTSNGGKTRTTEAIDINGGPAKVLHEETVDKFFSAVNATGAAVSPDRRSSSRHS